MKHIRHYPRLLLTIGIALMLVSSALFGAFLFSLSSRSAALQGIGKRLAALRSEVGVLKSIAAFEQSAGRDVLASREEQMAAYVLPATMPSQRMTRALEESVRAINDGIANTSDKLKLESVHSAAEQDSEQGLRERLVQLTITGSPAAVGKFLSILDISGTPTVGDVLGSDAVANILKHTEVSSPEQLPTVQSALALDVMATFADRGGTFERLIVELPPTVGEELRLTLTSAGLIGDSVSIDHAVATKLLESRSWPMPLMLVDSAEGSGGKWTVGMRIFSRKS